MQQNMEILSLGTSGMNSGSGSKPLKRRNGENSANAFTQVFDNQLQRGQPQKRDPGRGNLNRGNFLNDESLGRATTRFEPGRRDRARMVTGTEQNLINDQEDLEGILAAGAMVNPQNEVVFILEGNVGVEELDVPASVEMGQAEKLQMILDSKNTELEQKTANAIIQNFETVLEEISRAQTGEKTLVANAVETLKTDTTTTNQTGTANQAPDKNVEARMPEAKASNDNTGSLSQFSKNDNLSPLENKNEPTKTVEQNTTKTFSEIENTLKEAVTAETKRAGMSSDEPLHRGTQEEIVQAEVLPPLAEGLKPEQFRATQQMTQTTLEAPVKPENLFQELVSRAEILQNAARSTMSITLNPEHLGKVALEVAVDAAGLHVKINAEDSGVRGMLNTQITALIETLEQRGLAVAEVEVIQTGMEFNHSTFKEGSDNYQKKSSSKPSKGKIDGIKSGNETTYYTTLPDIMDYYMEAGVSSVEYTA